MPQKDRIRDESDDALALVDQNPRRPISHVSADIMSSSDQLQEPQAIRPLEVLYCQSKHNFHYLTRIANVRRFPSLHVSSRIL
jgi:hypothetical protein